MLPHHKLTVFGFALLATVGLLVWAPAPDLTVAVAAGKVAPVSVRTADSQWAGTDTPILRYGGLTAYDVDPFVQQAKLTASDGAAEDYFGFSAALSNDGNTALVGAYGDDVDGKADQGSAYVLVRSGSSWTQQAKLIASDGGANDYFGTSVALSNDGNTALVGAEGDNTNQGAAYVFVRSGSTWAEQQKLTASGGAANDHFGNSVVLSDDGNTALVGASWAGVGGRVWQGAAYVFVRSDSTWTEQQKLSASDGAAVDHFGFSAALSGDGKTALAGARWADVGGRANQGAAYVFAYGYRTYLPLIVR